MTLTWVTVHDTGGGWAPDLPWHPIFELFLKILYIEKTDGGRRCSSENKYVLYDR